MKTETKEILLYVICFGMFSFGLWGWSSGTFESFIFTTIIAVILAIIALFHQKASYGAKVSIVNEKIEATFFPQYGKAAVTVHEPRLSTTIKENAFIGGRLRTSLIFYNGGDKMSVVTIKNANLPNLNLEPHRIDESFNIQPHSHYEYKFQDTFFSSKDHINPISISLLHLEYNWVKKGQLKVKKEDISIICEIFSPK